MDVDAFIARWTAREGGAERANYQMFLAELCDVLGVARPDPAGTERGLNAYVFERAVSQRESAGVAAPRRIDLYKRGCFILEAKQSRWPGGPNALPAQLALFPEEPDPRAAARGWDAMMQSARKQAESYVFLLDPDQPAPPFIIVCDVGRCVELYADFSGTGRAYSQFPDRKGFRISMEDLRRPEVRRQLAAVWTEPLSLDPARESARVTREIAKRLAEVSRRLEEEKGANPEDVAHFLMRCLFTMFSEDTELLPKESFSKLLEKCVADPAHFALRLKDLWSQMEKGVEFSHVIEAPVRHFNGGLFKDTSVFELEREEIGELLAAAKADWKLVDPAIFGTLLEQALSKEERRRLGAHYTPRAYVQRLVEVTVMEPLRADWQVALTKAQAAKDAGKTDEAINLIRAFHGQLCTTRVLDPACGTGNFLYVSLELMKKLEGEVLQAQADLGDTEENLALHGAMVDPHQFLGLELNPRAAAIAELVIWIGYLQWHYRNTSSHPQEPILRAFQNINGGKPGGYDAVLTWDGYPIPCVVIEGQEPIETYPSARRPAWPSADFIVGNPPFIGSKRSAAYLTRSYVRALRAAEPAVPKSVDYVMYWWNHAAQLVAGRKVRRAGLVATNSITQFYNRRLLAKHFASKQAVSLIWAVPDHPWVDVEDGAAVRVSMGCMEAGTVEGSVALIQSEEWADESEATVSFAFQQGAVNEKFRLGESIYQTKSLLANARICWQGVKLVGDGFRVGRAVRDLLISGGSPGSFFKPYLTGMAVNRHKLPEWVIDFFGLSETEARNAAPQAFQHVLQQVKPYRAGNADEGFRTKWWIFGRPRPEMREAIGDLKRYLVTSEVSKHRIFSYVADADTLADGSLIVVASEDAEIGAILSSHIHRVWTLWGAGVLEDRPRYQNQLSFDPFPFSTGNNEIAGSLRDVFLELDATRKRVLAEQPDLTLTSLYNVLEKIKSGVSLTEADDDVKRRGLVLILKEMHDRIDALAEQAYGWPPNLTDEQVVERLVALNAERAREEAAGHVRWLRPDFQIPRFAKVATPKTGELGLVEALPAAAIGLPSLPRDRYEHPLAVEALLVGAGRPMTPAEIARGFRRGGRRLEPRVVQALATLARYGRVSALADGRFSARRAA